MELSETFNQWGDGRGGEKERKKNIRSVMSLARGIFLIFCAVCVFLYSLFPTEKPAPKRGGGARGGRADGRTDGGHSPEAQRRALAGAAPECRTPQPEGAEGPRSRPPRGAARASPPRSRPTPPEPPGPPGAARPPRRARRLLPKSQEVPPLSCLVSCPLSPPAPLRAHFYGNKTTN